MSARRRRYGEISSRFLDAFMIRVRFAPAPTGFLHIGSARTYIFNWLFARHNKGTMVLRIDDTDAQRNDDESLRSILDGLTWLELPWDEQHTQSERRTTHLEAAQALLCKGMAYRDFTEESSDTKSKEAESNIWLCNPGMRELSQEESERRAIEGEHFVIRFRVPREAVDVVEFRDHVYREQSRKIGDLEDFALMRSDGTPTYHLASTVDDGELNISHVVRGQDHLTNTFKHILLFEALGYARPEFAHLPLLLGPDGSKLSKRKHGAAVSVNTYRSHGFLPHGFVNYLSLLGWSPKDNRELLSHSELIDLFGLEGINRTNAMVTFDESSEERWADSKALWVNGQQIRNMPVEELMPYVVKELREAGWWKPSYDGPDRSWLVSAVDLMRSRFTTLKDFRRRGAAYFSDEFVIDSKAKENLAKRDVRELLHDLAERLAVLDDFREDSAEHEVRNFIKERGLKAGLVINAARAALSGQSVGPSTFAIFGILGRDRAVKRLREA